MPPRQGMWRDEVCDTCVTGARASECLPHRHQGHLGLPRCPICGRGRCLGSSPALLHGHVYGPAGRQDGRSTNVACPADKSDGRLVGGACVMLGSQGVGQCGCECMRRNGRRRHRSRMALRRSTRRRAEGMAACPPRGSSEPAPNRMHRGRPYPLGAMRHCRDTEATSCRAAASHGAVSRAMGRDLPLPPVGTARRNVSLVGRSHPSHMPSGDCVSMPRTRGGDSVPRDPPLLSESAGNSCDSERENEVHGSPDPLMRGDEQNPMRCPPMAWHPVALCHPMR